MKKENLISIIVPVYKVEKFLKRCVDSITNQTYDNLEILLIDDGSPDGSPAICDELAKQDKRIRVFHKENGGVSSARNLGIKECTGDYIAFVDSDDWIEPTMYEEMLALSLEKDADITFCEMKEFYDDGRTVEYNEINLHKLENKEIMYFFSNARKGNTLVTIFGGPCRMLVKSKLAKKHSFTTKLKHGEDLFFVLDLIEEADKIATMNRHFYNYYINSASVCHNINENYFRNVTALHKYAQQYIKDKNLDYEFLINHTHLYRNVINRAHLKDFVKIMKDFYKNDEDFRNCFNLKNYKKIQKFEIGLKQKIRNFLMYHRMWHLFKFLANKK